MGNGNTEDFLKTKLKSKLIPSQFDILINRYQSKSIVVDPVS